MLRALLLLLAAALAANPEVIPLEPSIVLDDLTASYRDAPTAERIDVRASAGGQVRAETIHLWIQPPDHLRIDFGDLVLWSDSKVIRIAHRHDEQGYFESPVDPAGLANTLEALLPPFPMPQISLAFADDPGSALTPYARGVLWTGASADDARRPAAVRLEGSSDRAEVLLTSDAESSRVHAMKISLDGGRTVIDLMVEPLPPAEATLQPIDLTKRERVSEISLLRPRPARVALGDTLPPMRLEIWRNDTPCIEEPLGPAAVVFLRRWRPGTSPHAAYSAAERIIAESPGFALYAVLVIEPGQPAESAFIDGAEQEADPIHIHRTHDPDGTIARFDHEADLVLVVIDRERRVKAVVPLPTPAPGAPLDEHEVERLMEIMRAGAR